MPHNATSHFMESVETLPMLSTAPCIASSSRLAPPPQASGSGLPQFPPQQFPTDPQPSSLAEPDQLQPSPEPRRRKRKQRAVVVRLADIPCLRCARAKVACEVAITGQGKSCIRCRNSHRQCDWPLPPQIAMLLPGSTAISTPTPVTTSSSSLEPPPHRRNISTLNTPPASPTRTRTGRRIRYVSASRPDFEERLFRVQQLLDWYERIDSDYPTKKKKKSRRSPEVEAESGDDSMVEGLQDEAAAAREWRTVEDVEMEYREEKREVRRRMRMM